MRLIIFFACLLPFSAMAVIHEVRTMEEVSSYFEEADQSALAVFDVDMVLIQPADPIFQMANIARHSHIAKKVFHSLSPQEQIIFLCLETIRSYPVLIETYTHQLLENLDHRHIKRVALTANLTGAFDCKKNMQEWVFERLNLCGIDFSKSFALEKELVFDNLPMFRNNKMLYYKGILFSNGMSLEKGLVLTEFLNRVNFAPRKIIFVDDRIDNLKSMEAFLEDKIEYIGLHYKGALDYSSPLITEDHFEKIWKERAEEAKKLAKDSFH